jgi:chemotaxis protein methyltransferase CheR
MNPAIMATLLTPLAERLASSIGLHFPPERWADLQRGLGLAAGAFGCADAKTCAQWLLSAPLGREQIEVLASCLTVGETYFFREKRSFEVLEQQLLPELIAARRGRDQRLRLWSAGCCTGEEPYSIAMTLSRLLPDIADWQVTLLATDINPCFLQKAAAGVFGEWSFRETPDRFKKEYFRRVAPKRYEIADHIKRWVTFAYLNLVEDVFPSLTNNTNAMDVIFCRNVLMYFEPAQARRVMHNLHCALVDNGCLLVSACEASQGNGAGFAALRAPGAVVYRKTSARQAAGVPEAEPRAGEPLTPIVFVAPEPPPVVEPPLVKASRPDPAPAPTPYEEALALFEKGLYAEAADQLVKLVAGESPAPKALALLARACANQGQLGEALHWCEQTLTADKMNPGFHYLRATILQEQGAVAEAAGSLKRALYLDPNFVLAHFALGNLARNQSKPVEAAKHFQHARQVLCGLPPDALLPEADGITAGRLAEIIGSMTPRRTAA